MPTRSKINRNYCTDQVRVDYAHVGLFDVQARQIWIARKRPGTTPIRVSHAHLLASGTDDTSTADKDRFVCFWFHTPNTGSGLVLGYPIEWEEGHLLVRIDPNWDYQKRQLVPGTDTAKVEHNIERQYQWGKSIFEAYVQKKPKFPINWHMIGPRATDSMFYVQRIESIR